ncbi:T9SS type A sorting domain-containing protein [Flavobacterium sp.]
MKKIFILLLFINVSSFSQSFNYQRAWATYFGDDSIRITGSDIDSNGNLFLVGFVNRFHFASTDSNFTTTALSYQPNFAGGISDGFIVKINPNGNIVWSTFFGGENADFITNIKIDNNNDLCIIGQTSSTQNMATTASYQTSTIGESYFLSKFSNDGVLFWSTYYDNYPGISNNMSNYNNLTYFGHSLDIDSSNNIYFTLATVNEGLATVGAYQSLKNQPTAANLISKFTPTGQRVWATYYGVNGSRIFGLCIGNDGFYVSGTTLDCAPTYSANTFFATAGCHQPTPGSCRDIFLSKFSLDGDRIWSTYYGNDTPERINDHSIVAFGDSVYLTATAFNQGGLTTPGSFQETNPSTNLQTVFLIKFNSIGLRQWSTFYGYQGDSSRFSRVSKDSNGNIFLSGNTDYLQNISSTGSYQELKNNDFDSFVAKFSPNGERQWGTYYGGNGFESENSKTLIYNDSFYITGSTNSTDTIATIGSFQPNYATNSYQSIAPCNFFIAKFESLPLSTSQNNENQFSIFPNPNKGTFSITFKDLLMDNWKLEVYDLVGKKVLMQNLNQSQTTIETNNLSKGLYSVKITNSENRSFNTKIIVE